MTIKWVKSDPLVMNGEPFCYGTRLTVRNLLEMRAAGLTPADILAEHPELRRVGIAEAFRYATQNRDRYAPFFEADGSLRGSGFEGAEASALPEHLRTVTDVAEVAVPAAGSPRDAV
jgi:uncharacterized protein (DUF433 family)